MLFRRLAVAAALVPALMVGAGDVAAETVRGQDLCAVDAYVRPGLTKAPPLRASPAEGSPVTGHLPMVHDPDRGWMGPSVVITGIREGHAGVRDIRVWDGEDIPLTGWIATPALAFVVQTYRGFAAPDPSAPVVWSGDDWITPDRIADILDCRGEWVALRLLDPAIAAPVWVRGVCGGQETTCDGVQGDR
ncbi:MAG: hypothetical protein MUF73_14030 [Rhodobacteraceae bacterium]|jgi:hypothetical protein|nr:hypothetical protein [Paracoccaceae bacterium]